MLLLAPLGIRALAALAGRAPVAVRLALRDLTRYQARSGAALAAASLAVGIAATIAVTAAAQQAHDHTLTGGNLPTNQLIVWLANPNDHGGPGLSVAPAGAGHATPAGPSPAGGHRAPGRRPTRSRRRSGSKHRRRTGQRRRPEHARAGRGATRREPRDLVHPTSAGTRPGLEPSRHPLCGDAGRARPLPDPGTCHRRGQRHPHLRVPTCAESSSAPGSRRTSGPPRCRCPRRLPNYTSAPNTLITPKAMTADDFTAEPAGWLVQARQALSAAQITDARQRAAAAGHHHRDPDRPGPHAPASARLLDAGRPAGGTRRAGHDRRADPQRDRS